MKEQFLRFNGAVERDPVIEVWMKEHLNQVWEPSRITGLK